MSKRFDFSKLPVRPAMTEEQIAAEEAAKKASENFWQKCMAAALFVMIAGMIIGVAVSVFSK